MNIEIMPGERWGEITAPSSKSMCHRLLICGALGRKKVNIDCGRLSQDTAATCSCLKAMGADIKENEKGILSLSPVSACEGGVKELHCGESGSVLRFLLPTVGVLGARACFFMEGRLAERPVNELASQLSLHGMSIEKTGSRLLCSGRLRPGTYTLPGNRSSQYISALLMALPLLDGESRIEIEGRIESEPYIKMTEAVLRLGKIRFEKENKLYIIPGNQSYELPESLRAEGDYSSASAFLCAAALSERGIRVNNLPAASAQGDREIVNILRLMGADVKIEGSGVTVRKKELRGCTIDASQIPDLIPALAALASLARGRTEIINAGRLRLKESDRLRALYLMLSSLGADIEEKPDGLIIRGRERLKGGSTDSFNDHRIAMAAALAACRCECAVTIKNAEAVNKSYPEFFDAFAGLKGAGI